MLSHRRAQRQIVPLHLREALPRYEMHLFTRLRPRRGLQPVIATLQRQLAGPVPP